MAIRVANHLDSVMVQMGVGQRADNTVATKCKTNQEIAVETLSLRALFLQVTYLTKFQTIAKLRNQILPRNTFDTNDMHTLLSTGILNGSAPVMIPGSDNISPQGSSPNGGNTCIGGGNDNRENVSRINVNDKL